MIKPIRVFLASPDDVTEERNRVQRVIEQLSRSRTSKDHDLIIELLRWETHTRPDMGPSVVLQQLKADSWDIFIGILWLKFGTPTNANPQSPFLSGTEEEFQAAYTRWRESRTGWPRIMFYRCKRPPADMDALDTKQFENVRAFFHNFSADGLHPGFHRSYTAIEEFEDMLHEHLTDVLYEYKDYHKAQSEPRNKAPDGQHEATETADPDVTDIAWPERDQSAIDYFISLYSDEGRESLTNDTILRWLQRWQLIRMANDNHYFTGAGALLFGPQDQHSVQTDVYISYHNKDGQFMRLEGLCLMCLAQKLLRELAPLWERRWEEPDKRDESGKPIKFGIYPETAIVEASVNLIIHRDYSSSEKAYVDVYENRIVFMNPGSSQHRIESLLDQNDLDRRPYKRNSILINTFSRTGLNQTQRRGIRRIHESLLANGNYGPDGASPIEIESPENANTFKLVLYARKPPETSMSAVDRESALGRYLRHLIGRNRYLQLQGIRSSGKLVHIELDRIYIRLRTIQQGIVEAEVASGELHRRQLGAPEGPRLATETLTVAVEAALTNYPRLIILGDPGSGKTTLLRYLALLYARDLAENSALVPTHLIAAEPRRLPILLSLRQLGLYLQSYADANSEGHAQLLDFLLHSLREERIPLPADFFDHWLTAGNAVILLDSLDEVANPDLRRRVARLVESFTRAYPTCRYVVTSRIVGYTGAARLGEAYTITTVRDFTLADVEQFLANWHRLVAIGQAGDSPSAAAAAADQTRQLLEAIQTNERIRELAINPLMLTVIALVHRDRVKLPDRRAELYAEAVDVLLGKWDEARGVQELPILPAQPFETNDKRLLLENVALTMHATGQKEINLGELSELLAALFDGITHDERTSDQAVTRFLAVIQERTGLLLGRGEGVFTFSHLTFQEYLAARAVAARDDYVAYLLDHLAEPWWREVILLTAGYLSTQSKERTTRLIRAIADYQAESEPYHNLVLAADCLRDVGASRVEGNLEALLHQRLRKGVETPPPFLRRWFKMISVDGWIERRSRAMEALVRAGAGFWILPYGEPEWVAIPAGEFGMGGDAKYDEKPIQSVALDSFYIARLPITNAQYHLFTLATDYPVPPHWENQQPLKGMESHPVVNVTWSDTLAYCRWLSQVTGKNISLPSDAEWERAARGDKDTRAYPWGNRFDPTKCNSEQLALGTTTPVGIFPDGASLDGCLDMAGNVWEWTCSTYKEYPSNPQNGREKLDIASNFVRVVRGGSFNVDQLNVRCISRVMYDVSYRSEDLGFRVVSHEAMGEN